MIGDLSGDSSTQRIPSRDRIWLAVIAVAGLAVVIIGWQMLLFFTDSAFGSFRYVSNAVAGRGLTWNPSPFPPVEGYASFLWLNLLRGIWLLTGLTPPTVANPLSLLFGLGSMVLVGRAVYRFELGPRLEGSRLALVALTVLGIATNRTFLTWLSSGFETALFNLVVLWWALEALAPPRVRGRWWLARLSTAAALTALTRIDGQAEVRATVIIALLAVLGGALRPKDLLQILPLGAVGLHLVWRHSYYGSWIPNVRVAEFTEPWPESGLRYTASFVLEYGIWIWGILVVAWAVKAMHAASLRLPQGLETAALLEKGSAVVAVSALLWPVLYCTVISGGDHFEYRTYSYLIPLLFASAAWMAVRVTESPSTARGLVAAFIFASWPIPWCHFEFTHYRTQRGETFKMVVPVAPALPIPLRWVAAPWDDLQAWLIPHMVCMRHQEHKIFYASQVSSFPPRAEGSKVGWEEGHPTLFLSNAGVAGWDLPNVAILDERGINDAVISHNPVTSYGPDGRQFAHDHVPPPGYVACLRPDVEANGRSVTVTPRAKPLTDDDIRDCETRAWY